MRFVRNATEKPSLIEKEEIDPNYFVNIMCLSDISSKFEDGVIINVEIRIKWRQLKFIKIDLVPIKYDQIISKRKQSFERIERNTWELTLKN